MRELAAIELPHLVCHGLLEDVPWKNDSQSLAEGAPCGAFCRVLAAEKGIESCDLLVIILKLFNDMAKLQ